MDAHANEALSRAIDSHLAHPPAPRDPEAKFCGKCKPPNLCCCLVEVQAPLDCIPCARSKTSNHIYAEIPISGDWKGRNFVMRIGCTCDKCMAQELEKDDTRIISFELIDEAVSQWNQMQQDIENGVPL